MSKKETGDALPVLGELGSAVLEAVSLKESEATRHASIIIVEMAAPEAFDVCLNSLSKLVDSYIEYIAGRQALKLEDRTPEEQGVEMVTSVDFVSKAGSIVRVLGWALANLVEYSASPVGFDSPVSDIVAESE